MRRFRAKQIQKSVKLKDNCIGLPACEFVGGGAI